MKNPFAKINFRKVGIVMGWTALATTLIFSLAFVDNKEQEMPCKDLIIKIDNYKNHMFFIEKNDVLNELNDKAIQIVGVPAGQLDIGAIEKIMRNNPYVKNSEVYMSIDGNLNIDIIQRVPVVRVFNSRGESYYLDETGTVMPVSDKFSSRVLVVTGNIPELRLSSKINKINVDEDSVTAAGHTLLDSVMHLVNTIRLNDFMHAFSEQIVVNSDREFEIIPKIGKQTIVVGSIENLEDKFYRLETLLGRTVNDPAWNQYQSVNLKFKNQVVCTKKTEIKNTEN